MTVVYVLVACVALALTADTLFALWLMLYGWDHPERLRERAGPEVLASPRLSFSALVPARSEATVIQETVARLREADYPSELLEIIVICQADDAPTIAAVRAAAVRHDVRLEIYDEAPFNKPHALQHGYAAASNEVICVFDAEDDVHPEIFNVVNTMMAAGQTGIVQGGVQLMNLGDHWFSALNCVEYFLYFGSRLHFNARVGMVPLAGNTVFISRGLIDRVGGWNTACLTEDAEIGVRLSALGEPIRTVYDTRRVTREETPHSVGDFIRQRTRWHQGFLQILQAGEWKRIPGVRRRILARLTFGHPLRDALLGLFTLVLPVSIIFVRLPDLLTLVLMAPLYALLLQLLANMVALVIFCRSFNLPQHWRCLALMPIVFLPYQWMLSFSAGRAVVRHLRGRGEWEKTAHRGAHRVGGQGLDPGPGSSAGAPFAAPIAAPVGAGRGLGLENRSARSPKLPSTQSQSGARHAEPAWAAGVGAHGALEPPPSALTAEPALVARMELEGALESTRWSEIVPESGQPAAPLSRWAARRDAIAQAMVGGLPVMTGTAVPELGPSATGARPLAVPFASIAPAWSARRLAALLSRRRVALAVGALLLVSALAHGIDLLHYPFIRQDEGTYFGDAWAIFHLGRLAPYTYFYDHAPLGWIQMALWQLFTFGKSFGYGVASGRVLMLLFELGSALLVVGIGRRATGRWWVGLVAAALMSLEPYSIEYQRQILLDNIAVFWLLLSVLAVAGEITLRRVWLSAASLAIAILSKEVAIAAYPVLAVYVWRRSPKELRLLAIASWLAISLSLCSVYALMALLKGELFQTGGLLGGNHPHVSLLCTIAWQSSRGGGSLVNFGSQFWQQMPGWLREASPLVAGGTAAAIGLVCFGRRLGAATMIAWITLALWLFLGRGGVVSDYYLLPLLPFLALSLTLAAAALLRPLQRHGRVWSRLGGAVLATLVLGSTAVAYANTGVPFWTGDQVSGQLAAERWIETHLPSDSRLVIDMSMWQDLQHPASGRAFKRAEYYWKAAEDPMIRGGVFHDDWRDVNYVITTPQMVQDTFINGFRVVKPALQHSQLVRAFSNGGWPIEIRRVLPRSHHILFSAPQSAAVLGSTSEPSGCMG